MIYQRLVLLWCGVLSLALVLSACGGDDPAFEKELSPVHTDLTYIKDAEGRYVYFNGVNVGGSTKIPQFIPDEVFAKDSGFNEGRKFTYGGIKDCTVEGEKVNCFGRPFGINEADKWFKDLKDQGFNSIRLLFMWEALYPDKKGKLDQDFIDFFDQIIGKANEQGIYVLLNAHENLFSRHIYALYNEWPTCAQCCHVQEKNGKLYGVRPDGSVDETRQCTKAENESVYCDEVGHPIEAAVCKNLWSLLPDKRAIDKGKYMEGFTDKVSGDGAPLWAAKACLPEKNFDSKYWGVFKPWGTMVKTNFIDTMGLVVAALKTQAENDPNLDPDALAAQLKTYAMIDKLFDDIEPHLPPDAFGMEDTNDMLALTLWGLNGGLSLNVNRCYASFFAGKDVWPQTRVLEIGVKGSPELGVDLEVFDNVADAEARQAEVLKDATKTAELKTLSGSLQESFRDGWREIAHVAKKYPNVIGYDMMNEPMSVFILLTAVAAYFELGGPDGVKKALESLLPQDILGEKAGTKAFNTITALDLLPKDNKPETRARWGLKNADLGKILGLNNAFDKNYLRPLFQYVGEAILEEYQTDTTYKPILWLEPAFSPTMVLGSGVGGWLEQFMTVPTFPEKYGQVQTVYSPHWYPDIYPMPAINEPSRIFSKEAFRFRDWTETLKEKADWAAYALSNIPVVYGEFGTYWNYRYENEMERCTAEGDLCLPGYMQSRMPDNNYSISADIMDNYYEAFDKMFMSRIAWCWTSDNNAKYGDWWDHEDFSVIGDDHEPRGASAWMRPYPRALSGKPVSMHFYSDHHYYDPSKGVPDPRREFELVFESKETKAPTILYVPQARQYPEGFYVWLSDGWAAWNKEDHQLYYYPTNDDPSAKHKVTIRPPTKGQDISGWKYFVNPDGSILSGN